ncbi:MAG: TonB family protein [Gammaproteobacteria bacterium]|nr:TonB family protein [Gammaproteobacteria bacterium]
MRKDRQQAKPRIADPRLLIPWSEAASRDRLSSTLFLAGLMHAVILLGVTFTGVDAPPEQASTSFDVVLITDTNDLATPTDSDVLAQQNMTGAGNTDEPMQLRTALSQALQATELGPENIGVDTPQTADVANREERPTIVAHSIDAAIAPPDDTIDEELQPEQQQTAFIGTASAVEIINKPDAETLITDNQRRELVISANTREARIAAYLSKWKNQIERVGTLNYPNVAKSRGLTRFPTLEVAIDSDGELHEVIVRSSSGIRSLDQAAMNIVNISAPFDPFPEFLRKEYDVLRFAYEWRFSDGVISSTYSSSGPLQGSAQ